MFQMRTFTAALLALGLMVHAHAAEIWPGEKWESATPAALNLDEAKLAQARDYALTGGGSGLVIRGGKAVLAWGDQAKLYDLKSTTKSFGATALGLALADGKVRLDDRAAKLHPGFGVPPDSNAQTGWLDRITLRHLVTQTAGFEKPGGFTNLLFAPGSKWHYSDGGPNWLAECLTLAWRRDLSEVMFERVFTPLGIKPADLRWRENQYRPHTLDGFKRREFGAGIHANVDAMARHGLLWLRGGRWRDQQVLPADFVRDASRPVPGVTGLAEHDQVHGNASDHYGYLWWNNGDGTLANVPRDAFWTWGLYDSITLVVPSLDLVVARTGQSWKRAPRAGHYDVLKPFFEPIVAAVRAPAKRAEAKADTLVSASLSASYPPSPVIKKLIWAPKETIIRRAKGGDNWPLTWADDDALYTAYGDGRGFEPFVPEKLSVGLSRVFGAPPDFRGENLRAPSLEAIGDDKRGRKASGFLCVNSVLYLLARNAGNAQLAWSSDHGATWSWADWKFTESFGCPTFLNFGRNYTGARDGFVYVYSHDAGSAYEPADRFVLARAPMAKLREREAYEFFARLDSRGQPVWVRDIAQRGAVFTHPGNSHRSGVSYNAALKRYLWCQILPKSKHPQGPRFQGGFGIYDAPEPWGPWTTVFFTEEWDVGPGETSSFPTKWMSADGKSLWLVFSGDDHFSVRKGTLVTAGEPSLK